MDPLKIFATLETPFSEAQLRDHFRRHEWREDAATGELSHRGSTLNLEGGGDHFYLLRGSIAPDADLAPLLRALELPDTLYSLDLFEEDGRLVRRIQSRTSQAG